MLKLYLEKSELEMGIDIIIDLDKFNNINELKNFIYNLGNMDEEEYLAFIAYMEHFYNIIDAKCAYEYVKKGNYKVYKKCVSMAGLGHRILEQNEMLKMLPEDVKHCFDYEAYATMISDKDCCYYIDDNVIDLGDKKEMEKLCDEFYKGRKKK